MKLSHLQEVLEDKDYTDEIEDVWVIARADYFKTDDYEKAESAKAIAGVLRPKNGNKLFLVF